MSQKRQDNHVLYLQSLSRMTPEERLQKAFELSDMTKQLLREGLRQRFPGAGENELHALFLERLKACHNRNY